MVGKFEYQKKYEVNICKQETSPLVNLFVLSFICSFRVVLLFCLITGDWRREPRKNTRVSCSRVTSSHVGLTLETSAFRVPERWPIYIINSVGKTKIILVYHSPNDAALQFVFKLIPLVPSVIDVRFVYQSQRIINHSRRKPVTDTQYNIKLHFRFHS